MMRATTKPPRPAHQGITLPNGLPVILRPMDHVASVSVGIWVRAGGRYETAELSGVSHFLEHLLFKGTRTRSCERLKQAIEGIGGSFNGFTAEEFTCYMVKVPAQYLRRAVAVLSDMVLHPAFRPRDIDKEREVILEEIRMYDDTPAQAIHDVFNQLMWPNHPLGNLLSGTTDTVRRIRRRDLLAYWKQRYHARNLLVACAGAMTPEQVLGQLRTTFARLAGGSVRRFRPAPRPPRGPQIRLIHKATEQTHLCLGSPAIPRTHPQRFALELLHVILGANMSSRLFREVREKRGLVYEIGTQIKRYHDTGAFVIYAGCDPAKLTTTLQTVLVELTRMAREPVRASELRRAKEFYGGQLLMGLEDTMEQMLWIGEQMITVGRTAEAKDLLAHLNRVTAEQIQHVARWLFTSPRFHVAAIGPLAEQQASTLQDLCRRCLA
ncbi:MAG: insulinase family protein [Candidatus Omnitrophica bacterium]|nr:insulinase family protein [Candidatus Omnitrophota bacterium]